MCTQAQADLLLTKVLRYSVVCHTTLQLYKLAGDDCWRLLPVTFTHNLDAEARLPICSSVATNL